MPGTKIQYICDPDKNVKCNRNNCALKPIPPAMPGPCKHTTNINFAKQPIETVKIVVPMSVEEFNELKHEGEE